MLDGRVKILFITPWVVDPHHERVAGSIGAARFICLLVTIISRVVVIARGTIISSHVCIIIIVFQNLEGALPFCGALPCRQGIKPLLGVVFRVAPFIIWRIGRVSVVVGRAFIGAVPFGVSILGQIF